MFRPVMKELVKRGHEVTVLTPNPWDTHGDTNLTIIDLKFLYNDWKKIDFAETADMSPFDVLELLLGTMAKMMEKILTHEEVQPLLQKKVKFDAVISEFLGYTPMYSFAKLYGVPLIGMTSLDMSPSEHASIGNVVHPVIHPHLVFPFYDDLTFVQRISTTYMTWILNYFFTPKFGRRLDKIIDKYFGPNFTESYTITRNVSLVITNAHPALGFTRPIVPSTIQVGLMHVHPPKALDIGLQQYLDKSKNGVIYFSLGSNVKSTNLKKEHFDTFINVFKRLNYDILWKWENSSMPNKPDNVRIEKWLPQQDLLAHKNIKLFVTHGGQQSMEEAIDRGVPLIMIPFFGDQDQNSYRIEKLEIGKRLPLSELSVQKFESLIHEVITKERYFLLNN